MEIETLSSKNVKRWLSSPEYIQKQPFEILQFLCRCYNEEGGSVFVQELVLRALEHREHFGSYSKILDDLVRELGLFPYINPDNLSFSDRLAYYAHLTPKIADTEIVFHSPQAEIFYSLMSGRSVVVSAPTSFGKSLIIDAVIATEKFDNVIIIVPTLALIDETRRRLSKFKNQYKIITHAIQEKAKRNIYILTQERALEENIIEKVDFFVIDEFYKLSPWAEKEGGRCDLLNQIFYMLYKKCKHFYMLGPYIEGITKDFEGNIKCGFRKYSYHTVVTQFHNLYEKEDSSKALLELCHELVEPTLIFCKSPKSASDVSRILANQNLGKGSNILRNLASWIANFYHTEWHLVKAIENGIGVHHGRVPRAISQLLVDLFNQNEIKFLICTSTLIEGVNTSAKNVIVFDNTINKQEIDLFTFNNIAGRGGRMFKHFIGNVYLLHPPPQQKLPFVDSPAFSQNETASDSLLINIDEEDLKDQAKQRIQKYKEQNDLDFDTIKKNIGVSPEKQLEFARDLSKNISNWHGDLAWKGLPSWDELSFICNIIWNYFNGQRLGNNSASSPKQLSFLIKHLQDKTRIKDLILNQINYVKNKRGQCDENDIDEVIQKILDFRRLWANFHFPRLLRAINTIQAEIFKRHNLPQGDYSGYAVMVENYFFDPIWVALEEYGLPLEITQKLNKFGIKFGDSLDSAMNSIRKLEINKLGLNEVETIFLKRLKMDI